MNNQTHGKRGKSAPRRASNQTRRVKRRASNSKNKSGTRSSSNSNTKYSSAQSNGGYHTTTSASVTVHVYTVQNSLLETPLKPNTIRPLPIPKEGILNIEPLGIIPFTLHHVPYDKFADLYSSIEIPLEDINQTFQDRTTRNGLSRPNSYLIIVRAEDTEYLSDPIGYAACELNYALMPFHVNYSNTGPDEPRISSLDVGDPFVSLHLLGLTKNRLQLNSNFHGRQLLDVCMQLANQGPYYKKVGGILTEVTPPSDRLPRGIYLESLPPPKSFGRMPDWSVHAFYKRNGFVEVPKMDGRRVHPFTDMTVKGGLIPMILLRNMPARKKVKVSRPGTVA